MWLGGGALLVILAAARHLRGAGRLRRAAAARGSRRLARALDLVVDAARPLVGLRRPGARLSPLRGARAVARPAHARARERSLHRCSARSSSGRSRGKVLPFVHDYGPPALARLSAPVGLWNQLAVLGAFALPLALWRRRLAGTLLAYGWIVALLLTYSRGGILTALVVVAAWLALTDERIESAATLVAAAVPAAVVVGDRVRVAGRDERRPVVARALARRPDLRRAAARGRRRGSRRSSGCRARGSRRAPARPARRGAAPRRRRGGVRRAEGRRFGRRRKRRRPARLDELELPLRLVAAGVGRFSRSRARRHRRGHVPPREPALP